MTQPTVEDRPEPVFGIDPDILSTVQEMATDFEVLPASIFDGKQFTLVGFSHKAGGEKRVDESSGREYETSDQWLWHWRADDPDAAAMLDDERGGVLIQYITLPKEFEASNGKKGRASPTRFSQAGLLISAFDQLGVSGNAQRGYCLHLKDWTDAIGIQAIRERKSFTPPGRNARSIEIDVPISIVGMDTDYREEQGMPAVAVNVDTAPALNT